MPQGARDGGVAMVRMYGMPQGARDGGVAMVRMYGMPQGARFIFLGYTSRVVFVRPGNLDDYIQKVRHLFLTLS